jgi:hypothetical protein
MDKFQVIIVLLFFAAFSINTLIKIMTFMEKKGATNNQIKRVSIIFVIVLIAFAALILNSVFS